MGIFSWLFHSRDKPKNNLGGLSFLFGSTTAGQAVNESTSMASTNTRLRRMRNVGALKRHNGTV